MRQIHDIHARLQAGTGTSELLAAGWDAFSLLLDVCDAGGLPAEVFAACMFAAAAASRGRLLLESAPSLPASVGRGDGPAAVKADLERVTGELGELAAMLAEHLARAAAQASLAGDREACQDAAAEAAQAAKLLGGDQG